MRRAFRAELHQLDVNGERHIANMSDPQLPATLAPAVVGIASLSDFMPKAMHAPRTSYTVANGDHLVVPADLATI